MRYLTGKGQLFRLFPIFYLHSWLAKKKPHFTTEVENKNLHLLSISHESLPTLSANVSVLLDYKQHIHLASEVHLCLRSVRQ